MLQRHWELSRLYGIFVTPVAYVIEEQGIILKNVAVGVDAINTLLVEIKERTLRPVAVA